MNRLANALLFAVVVITAFVLEARSAWPQYSPAQVLARAVRTVRVPEAPVVLATLPPAIDPDEVAPVIERTQTARNVFTRTEVRRIQRQVRADIRTENARCKIVRIDQ